MKENKTRGGGGGGGDVWDGDGRQHRGTVAMQTNKKMGGKEGRRRRKKEENTYFPSFYFKLKKIGKSTFQ